MKMFVIASLLYFSISERENQGNIQQLISNDHNNGVYVFGSYVLDIGKSTEKYYPGREIGVSQCHTDRYFCLRAYGILGIANIVVPKTCITPHIGARWTVGGTTMVVRSLKYDLDMGVNAPVAILSAERHDNVLFYYAPQYGIVGLSIGPKMTPPKSTAGIMHRITLDSLFRCRA